MKKIFLLAVMLMPVSFMSYAANGNRIAYFLGQAIGIAIIIGIFLLIIKFFVRQLKK